MSNLDTGFPRPEGISWSEPFAIPNTFAQYIMAITHTVVPKAKHRGIVFPQHKLSHKYLHGLAGIELGAAAHNPFGLDSINVAPGDDDEFYRKAQIDMCGAYDLIDIVADGDNIPVEDDSQDYVISSHVVEHLADPIKAFLEWSRIVRDGGYVIMIVPQPDAHPDDRGLPLSTYTEIEEAYAQGYTVDSFPGMVNRRRGHYWRLTPSVMMDVISGANKTLNLGWAFMEVEERDTKVGNGWTLIYQVNKAPQKHIAVDSFVRYDADGNVIEAGFLAPHVEPTIAEMIGVASGWIDTAQPADQTVIVKVDADGMLFNQAAPEAEQGHKMIGGSCPSRRSLAITCTRIASGVSISG